MPDDLLWTSVSCEPMLGTTPTHYWVVTLPGTLTGPVPLQVYTENAHTGEWQRYVFIDWRDDGRTARIGSVESVDCQARAMLALAS